jgi:hypothetical protein
VCNGLVRCPGLAQRATACEKWTLRRYAKHGLAAEMAVMHRAATQTMTLGERARAPSEIGAASTATSQRSVDLGACNAFLSLFRLFLSHPAPASTQDATFSRVPVSTVH